ncbi:hypothetical protein CFC21_056889 [Triticum aestivum]|uniref:F-box domain-containing protein n=2 Tax=Triticum aestivum TaxID=4565 RepID=A0A3B6IN35_WHEAT|nr:uncharacterized protein LOC123091282 isoform X2 [Triticum aestivum]XP_044368680.1 uncharacterized protein LOC123091282 isoform X2 [Triticum aestivum]KAF7048073.1 hypothetical protein CFC21_056889 [Triticum aestivum]
MSRSIFYHIGEAIVEHDHDGYFKQKGNAGGAPDSQPTDGYAADAADEYVRSAKATDVKTCKKFVIAICQIFGDESLRSPNEEDTARLLAIWQPVRRLSKAKPTTLQYPPFFGDFLCVRVPISVTGRSTGGTHEYSIGFVHSSVGDELPQDAICSYARSSWSDLPTDLLLRILQRLQLQESLAFALVCTSWSWAAAAAGVPCSCRPWLMSWTHLVEESQPKINWSSTVTCKFRHLVDVNKSYDVDFPKGCFVACAGASHGWLVLVNELSNLLLFNPFTSDMVSLPPITDFSFVEAIYDNQGHIEVYRFFNDGFYDAKYLATWFFQKAVLSCTPSKGGNYIVMIIHYDSNWLSFVRAGEGKWQVVSPLARRVQNQYVASGLNFS